MRDNNKNILQQKEIHIDYHEQIQVRHTERTQECPPITTAGPAKAEEGIALASSWGPRGTGLGTARCRPRAQQGNWTIQPRPQRQPEYSSFLFTRKTKPLPRTGALPQLHPQNRIDRNSHKSPGVAGSWEAGLTPTPPTEGGRWPLAQLPTPPRQPPTCAA